MMPGDAFGLPDTAALKQCFIIEPAVRVIDEIQWVCLELISSNWMFSCGQMHYLLLCVKVLVQFFPCKVMGIFPACAILVKSCAH
jgi:hypothetical protein